VREAGVMNTIVEFFRLPVGVEIAVLVLLWPAIWAGMLITYALIGDVTRQDKGRSYGLERDGTVHTRMRKVS
jgi:hypothetical protein